MLTKEEDYQKKSLKNLKVKIKEEMKKIFIKTFGCQMNVYDSKRIADLMKKYGYEETDKISEGDIILFNTCHIREKAAEKVFSDLGRAKKVKNVREKQGKDTIIVVMGCVVQAEDDVIIKRAPYVDIALGPLAYHKLPELLKKVLSKRDSEEGNNFGLIDTEFYAEPKFDYLPDNKSQGACSFLAIQEGCDNFCTYCVVPYTRGIEYSRPIEDVLKEAKSLVNTGTLEINLLGQNVNSYHGEDKNGKERNIAYLINKLAEIDGLKRIRYTTSYPADVDDDLIEAHKNIKELMPYLHLPIQAGSDIILKAMNRRYSASEYLRLVEKLLKANSEIGFSSDFIVGFPGESDKDFEKTIRIVNEVKFIQAFSFKYSQRAGTPAAIMKNQIEENVKTERLQILQDLLFSYQNKFNKDCIDKTMPVLFEQKGRHKGQLVGRTPYMQNLYAEADFNCINKLIDVKIIDATTNSLKGEKVKG